MTVEEQVLALVMSMQASLEAINALKGSVSKELLDPRALSVAATNLETAMLWVANARQ